MQDLIRPEIRRALALARQVNAEAAAEARRADMQRNAGSVACPSHEPADARCTCGAYLYRSEMPHPDRDLEVYSYACPECRKQRFLLDLRAELDHALFEVWVAEPQAMCGEAAGPVLAHRNK